MPHVTDSVTTSSTSYTPDVSHAPRATSRQAAIAECVTAILEGRPLPEAWRAPSLPTPTPCSLEEGITRILHGRAR